jgi:flagellar biosynthesis protein
MKKNKREKAVALRYDSATDKAPVVAAKGQGEIAKKIIELAEEYGIPVEENQYLANYLMALDLHEEIPPVLYPVIAEILAFIYRMNRKYEWNNSTKTDGFDSPTY